MRRCDEKLESRESTWQGKVMTDQVSELAPEVTSGRARLRSLGQRAAVYFSCTTAVIPALGLIAMIVILFTEAFPAIRFNGFGFFTSSQWAVGNEYGTPVTSGGVLHLPGAHYGAWALIAGTLESSATALEEAAMCGTPVVGSDLPGAAESIPHDGVRGILAPRGNAPAVAAAVRKLLEGGRPSSPVPFRSWDDVAREYEALFAELGAPAT